jgi:S1-C subfamily serine protease
MPASALGRRPRGAAAYLIALALAGAGAAGSLAQVPVPSPNDVEVHAAVVSVGVRAVAHARGGQDQGRERQGTGIVVEPGGHVLTSALLVQEADSIVVTTADARSVRASVAVADETTGVAILRPAESLGVRALPLGASAAVGVPASATVAAAARGRRIAAVTVVAKREFAGHWEFLAEDALFTLPALPDWAGAALVDGSGNLIGVGCLRLPDVRQGAATSTPGNLFIPVEPFQAALATLARAGTGQPTRRPWLGLVMDPADDALAIVKVPPDSPAARAGLRVGDVVTGVNGQLVATRAALYRRLWRERPGADIVLTIRRDGAPLELRLRTMDRQDYLIHRAQL